MKIECNLFTDSALRIMELPGVKDSALILFLFQKQVGGEVQCNPIVFMHFLCIKKVWNLYGKVGLLKKAVKCCRPSADLRLWQEDRISPSALLSAARESELRI